jgi:hypothetical protein
LAANSEFDQPSMIALASSRSVDVAAPVVEGLPTTRSLTLDGCPVPQQFFPTTEQFGAFLFVDVLINSNGK